MNESEDRLNVTRKAVADAQTLRVQVPLYGSSFVKFCSSVYVIIHSLFRCTVECFPTQVLNID